MQLRILEGDRLALDVAGYGLPLEPKDLRDLALALAHRALSRHSTPSPVARLRLSGTGSGLLALVAVDGQGEGFDVSVRVSASVKTWLTFAVRLFRIGSGNPDADLEDLLGSEFAGEAGDA